MNTLHRFMWDETFDIGSDTGTSVNNADYAAPKCRPKFRNLG